jgi:hypothetical protein
MRRRLICLGLFSATIAATAVYPPGSALATTPEGYKSTLLAVGRFGEIDVSSSFPHGLKAEGKEQLWRSLQRRREFTNLSAERGDDGRCVLAGHFDQDDKARMSFHEGRDVTVAGAGEQIALPVTGNSAVFSFCRPLPDGDGIDDLTVGVSASPSVHGAADTPLGPQVLHQLFLQHSSSLDE